MVGVLGIPESIFFFVCLEVAFESSRLSFPPIVGVYEISESDYPVYVLLVLSSLQVSFLPLS